MVVYMILVIYMAGASCKCRDGAGPPEPGGWGWRWSGRSLKAAGLLRANDLIYTASFEMANGRPGGKECYGQIFRCFLLQFSPTFVFGVACLLHYGSLQPSICTNPREAGKDRPGKENWIRLSSSASLGSHFPFWILQPVHWAANCVI